jgi:hypothetical protein
MSDLLARTYELLDRRGTVSLRQIALETGLGQDWLDKFSQRRIREPGVVKVQRLHDYLAARDPQAA